MVAGKLDKVEVLDTQEEIGTFIQEPTTDRHALITDDPKCEYVCGSAGTDEDLRRMREQYSLISTQGVDYAIVTEAQAEHEEDTIDKRNSMSFMSVSNLEEGEVWYRQNFPHMPDELYPIMARWNFGDLSKLTKKQVKNDKRRVARGKKPQTCDFGLEVKKGPFVVEF